LGYKSTGVKLEFLVRRPSSAISDLTSSSLNLTIVGWDGSAWVTIPSIVRSIQGEISSLVSTYSSNAQLDLSIYSAFH
jgi:hypothetical protein